MTKVALITGCSSGLGKALARTLHSGSWGPGSASAFRVFATSRNTQDVEDLKLEGIDVVQLDVTDADSVNSAVEHVVQEAGGIDLLICNAGILRIGPLIEQKLSEIKTVFDTNVYGTLLCARSVATVMTTQRSGVIAVIGSISASITAPYTGAYSASKAASRSIAEALRLEFSPYSVNVTYVEGGLFRSSIVQKSTLDVSQYAGEHSLWRRAVSGIRGVAEYIGEAPTTNAEQVAVAITRRLCLKGGPPAHFTVADKVWINKIAAFIYQYISPDVIHKSLTSRFGLSQNW